MARPQAMKVILKPVLGLELKWRAKVMRETPSAAPTVLNMPRSPTMVATLSGSNSIQALLAAGNAIPEPIPEKSIRNESSSAVPHRMPIIRANGTPSPRRIVEKEIMPKPHTMGHRYPHRLSRKLVTVEAKIIPSDRGVSIIPLSSVESLCTEVA